MTSPRHLRHALASALTVLTMLAAGCAPIPAAGPHLAVSGNAPRFGGRDSESQGQSDGAAPPSGPFGALSPLRPDAGLDDCRDLKSALPQGIERRCLAYSPTNFGRGELELYAAVLSSDRAPADAPPLVVISGGDRNFDAVTSGWAKSLEQGLTWPVVVVEPRTALLDSTVCPPSADQLVDTLAGNAEPADSTAQRDATATLALSCQDNTGDKYLEFGSDSVAKDLPAVFAKLGLERAVLASAGAGIRAAARFSTDHPDMVAGIIADSPTTLNPRLADLATAQAEGTQLAFDTWLATCRATSCISDPLPDAPPKTSDLKDSTATAAALRLARNDLSGVAGPRPGTDGLRLLLNQARNPAQRLSAPKTDLTTQTFFSTCTDYPERPPVEQAQQLRDDLSAKAPTFGVDRARRATECADWPVSPGAAVTLPAVQALVLGTTGGDPFAGRDPAATGSAELTAAGVANAVPLRWGGSGSAVAGQSQCVTDALNQFLSNPASSGPQACPA